MKCWGDNGYGQLGYGDMRARGSSPADMGNALPTVDLGTGRTAIKVAAGAYDTCAVLDDSTLKCWGLSPLNGQPPKDGKDTIGDQPGEMGDNLPPLNFGGRKVVNVGFGATAACASLDDNTIWCWTATNGIPQMVTGLPSKLVKVLSPVFGEVVALYEDGTISNELPGGEPLIYLSAAGSNHSVVAISGTQGENCEVLDNGAIACEAGQFAKNVPSVAATSVGVEYLGTNAVCALFADGSVRCLWDSDPSRLTCTPEMAYWCDPKGTVTLGQGATAISGGGQGFTCALLADGGIKCWNLGSGIPAWLGAGVSLVSTAGYGPWNEIDLGSHP